MCKAGPLSSGSVQICDWHHWREEIPRVTCYFLDLLGISPAAMNGRIPGRLLPLRLVMAACCHRNPFRSRPNCNTADPLEVATPHSSPLPLPFSLPQSLPTSSLTPRYIITKALYHRVIAAALIFNFDFEIGSHQVSRLPLNLLYSQGRPCNSPFPPFVEDRITRVLYHKATSLSVLPK